jgi:hypothetical protein
MSEQEKLAASDLRREAVNLFRAKAGEGTVFGNWQVSDDAKMVAGAILVLAERVEELRALLASRA